MNKRFLILALAVFLIACDKRTGTDCADKVCDESFAMIMISFVDKDGAPVSITKFSAVNQRTLDTIKAPSSAYTNTIPGAFVVVDDNYLDKLRKNGDDIKVSGTYEATGATKSAVIKVSGGECACHVIKVSGPDKIVVN